MRSIKLHLVLFLVTVTAALLARPLPRPDLSQSRSKVVHAPLLFCFKGMLSSLDLKLARNTTLKDPPLPNPYPLPHAPYCIDFDMPGGLLIWADATECLVAVRQ